MIEKERKFIVDPVLVEVMLVSRGIVGKVHTATYFTLPPMPAVRVTYSPTTGKAKFCVKFPTDNPENREELEDTINVQKAQRAIELGPTKLVKVRHDVDGWEIDRFVTMKLCMAEWEHEEGKAPIPDPLPPWIIREVTDDPSYTNQALAWQFGRQNLSLSRDNECF